MLVEWVASWPDVYQSAGLRTGWKCLLEVYITIYSNNIDSLGIIGLGIAIWSWAWCSINLSLDRDHGHTNLCWVGYNLHFVLNKLRHFSCTVPDRTWPDLTWPYLLMLRLDWICFHIWQETRPQHDHTHTNTHTYSHTFTEPVSVTYVRRDESHQRQFTQLRLITNLTTIFCFIFLYF